MKAAQTPVEQESSVTITPLQRLLGKLWWGPFRRPFEAICRRALRRHRVLSGPLRGARFTGGLAQRLGVYELPAQETMVRHLRPGGVCYDIGGHNGYMSLLAARIVGPKGRVFTFEPVEANRRLLELALEQNGCQQVSLESFAVASETGHSTLFLGTGRATTEASLVADSEPSSSRQEGAQEEGETVQVSTIRLDDFVSNHPPPNFIKMDIEGAEGQALEGARDLLASQTPPTWLIEVHDPANDTAVQRLLTAASYTLTPIEPVREGGRLYPKHVLAVPKG
ncbi:MAG: FkbM family methyltransferase [Deltaproteobacteria bacterium]|nr:FkbM family methyltransferase [Deltaproteobacteria bacterium]